MSDPSEQPAGSGDAQPPRKTVERGTGSNESERYLQKLCERSFLKFWSHPCVYRDEGLKKFGQGKEVCDLLVVFGDDILIFSDKHCEYPAHADPHVAWSRWYKRAVLAGAKQIAGAEQWIKTQVGRLFLDPECKQSFPFPLPTKENARFHRIVVAHGASSACRKALGGSGSLMIDSHLIGGAHLEKAEPSRQFTIGQVQPDRGFVHVFDDTTLNIVMSTLDTTADFVSYLIKKEAFINRMNGVLVSGEEDLLAYYLQQVTRRGEHDFVVQADVNFLMFPEGLWEDFCQHPQRQAQIEANRVSYVWDQLIEKFSYHIMTGTQHYTFGEGLHDSEIPLRFLAAESRTRRRMLSESLLHVIHGADKTKRYTRVHKNMTPDEPAYVFLSLPYAYSASEESYRTLRRNMLEAMLGITKNLNPDAKHIVGLAITPAAEDGCSEDLMYLDASEWSDEQRAFADEDQREFGLLTDVKQFHGTYAEYPRVKTVRPIRRTPPSEMRGSRKTQRNATCPCGSGRKYKKCCGL